MGSIHKLKPQVCEFIIENKKNNSPISCRKLAVLVSEKFGIKVSKSSINLLIKGQGLSSPVGRTRKKKRAIPMPSLPILLEETPKEVLVQGCEAHKELSKISVDDLDKKEEARNTEDIKKQEEAAKKAQEEARKQAEEAARAEEQRKAEELRRQEESLRLEAEKEARLKEEERKRVQEEAAKKAQEDIARSENEAKIKAQEEARKQAEEAARAEEAKKNAASEEAARKAEEDKWLKKAEEERKKVEEEIAIREQKRSELEGQRTLKEEEKNLILAFKDGLAKLDNCGAAFLRAVDSILGAGRLISEAVKGKVGQREGLDALTGCLIYLPLLKDMLEKNALDKLLLFLDELQNVKVLNLDIAGIISNTLTQVRCVKVSFSDGSNIYLDGQMHSVWSSPHIPYDFAAPFYAVRKHIDSVFNKGSQLIIFTAPGYDMPSQDFLDFLLVLETANKKINSLTLYGNDLAEIETMPVAQENKRQIIFGVWPWQFVGSRRVKNIGNFRSFKLENQQKDLYAADIEMEIANTSCGKQITLRGCSVKENLSDKTKLVILSNLQPGTRSIEDLAGFYLNCWPNLEEAFQDYSRKIEFFTYTANSQHYFSLKGPQLEIKGGMGVKELFNLYFNVLDAYLRWSFLPSEYEAVDFSEMKNRFYGLAAHIHTVKEDKNVVNFLLPAGYAFAKDLSYVCRRVNERSFLSPEGLLSYFKAG